MKKENCPFCGHRWIRKSSESMIECPNCRTEYFIQLSRHEETEDEEIVEEEETIADEFEERNL
jgi:predicted  nucleic acid-binding Zn-ribbon protein